MFFYSVVVTIRSWTLIDGQKVANNFWAENGINASPFSFDRCEWTINEKDILYT